MVFWPFWGSAPTSCSSANAGVARTGEWMCEPNNTTHSTVHGPAYSTMDVSICMRMRNA